MNNKKRLSLCAVLMVFSSVVSAADAIVGISPSTRATLDVFDNPGATEPAQQIPAAEIPMPLPIAASQAGFFKVSLGGRDGWVKGAQVRVKRETGASCAGKISQFTPTGSTAGAGGDACK